MPCQQEIKRTHSGHLISPGMATTKSRSCASSGRCAAHIWILEFPAGCSHNLAAGVFLLLQGTVAHGIIGVAPGSGAAALFRLRCGEELPCGIVGIGLIQHQQVVGQVPVAAMVAVFPCPVRFIGGVGLAAFPWPPRCVLPQCIPCHHRCRCSIPGPSRSRHTGSSVPSSGSGRCRPYRC